MNDAHVKDRELRIALSAISAAKRAVRARLENCTYCDQGVDAYRQAEDAIDAGFKDVRGQIHYAANVLANRGGGL